VTITLYVLAYFVIGFGGMGALVWWRPEWFYEWKPGGRPWRPEGRWEMREDLPPWTLCAVAWPIALAVTVVVLPCGGAARLVERMEQGFTAKLDRLREIDQEVAALRAERERMLKEAGL
jgi:hypothetical protein